MTNYRKIRTREQATRPLTLLIVVLFSCALLAFSTQHDGFLNFTVTFQRGY